MNTISVNWDTIYNKQLIRTDNNLPIYTPVNATTNIDVGYTVLSVAYGSTQVDFIQDDKYMYNTVLDGKVDGNARLKFKNTHSRSTQIFHYYVNVKLIAMKSDATERTFLNLTTETLTTSSVAARATVETDVFWKSNLDNVTIDYDEKLVLRLIIYSAGSLINGYQAGWLMHGINTDNVYVELPIV